MTMAIDLAVAQRMAAERRFFVGMALAIVASVFLGFARTFYLRPLFPDMPAPAERIFLIHGLVFSGWIVLLLAQVAFIARKRVDLHRQTGAWGIVLALGVIALGAAAAIIAARRPGGFIGIPLPPLQFLAVPLASMVMFSIFVALGIARRRDAQAHKRFMLLASFQMVTPAIARWPVVSAFGPPAFFGITDLFVIALAVWDFRSRGRLHAVTLWGGLATMLAQPAQLALLGTDFWLGVARWLTGVPG
jgi:uncharacterized membrane protein YozB (DUF420 family)